MQFSLCTFFLSGVVITSLLSACGGGGSSSEPSDPINPPTTPPPTTPPPTTPPPSPPTPQASLQLSVTNLKGNAQLLWQGETLELLPDQSAREMLLDQALQPDSPVQLTAPAFQSCQISRDDIVDSEQTIEITCSEPEEHSLVVNTENLKGELTIQWDGQTITLTPDAHAETLKSSNPNIRQPTLVNPVNQSCTGDALGLETTVAVWKLVCVDGEPVTHSVSVSKPLDYPVTVSLGNQTQVVQYESVDFDQKALATEEARITHLGGQQRCKLNRSDEGEDRHQKWQLDCKGFVFYSVPEASESSLNGQSAGASIADDVFWFEEGFEFPKVVAVDLKQARFVTLGTHHYVLGIPSGLAEITFDHDSPTEVYHVNMESIDARVSNKANILSYHTTFEAIYVNTETDGVQQVYRVNAEGEVARLNAGSPLTIRPIDDFNDEVALLSHNSSPNATEDNQTLIDHYKKGQLTQTNRLPLPYDDPSVQVGSLDDIYSFVFYHDSPQRYIGTVSKSGVKEHSFIGDFPEQVRVITRPFPETSMPHRWGPYIYHGDDEVDVGLWSILDSNKHDEHDLSTIKAAPLFENTPVAVGTSHSTIVEAKKLNQNPFSLHAIDHRWYGKFDPEWNSLDGDNVLVQTHTQPISEGSAVERVEIPMVGDWMLLWEPDRLSQQDGNLNRGFVSYTNGNSSPHRDPYLLINVSYEQFQQFELITATPFFVAFKDHEGKLVMFTQPDYGCELSHCQNRREALVDQAG